MELSGTPVFIFSQVKTFPLSNLAILFSLKNYAKGLVSYPIFHFELV